MMFQLILRTLLHWIFIYCVTTTANTTDVSINGGKLYGTPSKIKFDSEDIPLMDRGKCVPKEEEQLGYFREDFGISLHHNQWHTSHPHSISLTHMGHVISGLKDRHGELFYYMHQQVLARYNAERLCHNLPNVVPLTDETLCEVIPEGYYPVNLHDGEYTPREPNLRLPDYKLRQFKMWINNINAAIDNIPEEVKENPIDFFGVIIQPEKMLPQYGSLHNSGHMAIAGLVHSKNLDKGKGVMTSFYKAMQDPVFFRWHGYIDEKIYAYTKKNVPAYTRDQLEFRGVHIEDVEVITEPNESLNITQPISNILITFMQQHVVNLHMDRVIVRYNHLQRQEFFYKIKVKSDDADIKGTVRIFIAPAVDQDSKNLTLAEQQRLFIELDKFVIEVQKGKTETFIRYAKDSSVAIPHEQIYADVQSIPISDMNPNGHCGCGWPSYLLIPKGKNDPGMKFTLFVIISNYNDDKVEGDWLRKIIRNSNCGGSGQPSCAVCDAISTSYCGVKNSEYPDKKPMGYPFDRKIDENSIANVSNVAMKEISIIHIDKLLDDEGQVIQK